MGDKGKRDKGKREEQKKGKQTLKEKRKQKKIKINKMSCQDIPYRSESSFPRVKIILLLASIR